MILRKAKAALIFTLAAMTVLTAITATPLFLIRLLAELIGPL